MQQIASQNSPSPSVVIPHYVFGGLSLLIASILIVCYPDAFNQHYFNPRLLSITHLLVLGWITMIIFGALYQLLPVIMEVKLNSEVLARISFWLMATGTIMLSYAFWQFSFGSLMFVAGTLIVMSVFLFVLNVIKTAKQSVKNTIERLFILSSAYWLMFTVMAGLTLAVNLSMPFLNVSHLELLKLHAHAGLVGWFIQLIIGVSCKLLPMFMVSHHVKTGILHYTFWSMNLGLILGIVALYLQIHGFVIVSAVLVVSGIVIYLRFLLDAYRKRVKKQLDIGMRQSAFSYAILLIPMILVFLLLFRFDFLESLTIQLSITYGTAIVIGFITSLVMGQTYKTLPFIVWLKIYRGKVGRVVLPLPKDLYSEKAAVAQVWLYGLGILVLLVGIVAAIKGVVLLGGIILLLSTLLYNFSIFKIVLHKPTQKSDHK